MKKGFTLIELLAVIIILAILMIIAVPNILSTLSTARSSAFITQAQSIYKSAEKLYMIDQMSGNASSCYDTSNLNNYFYFGSLSKTYYSSQSAEEKAVQESYHWLFDYTEGCTSYGCTTEDSSTSGYWTSNYPPFFSLAVWGRVQ